MKNSSGLKLYGILGYPLGHTLSPAMQEAAFGKTGPNAHYLALELPPASFRKAMRRLSSWIIDGANVTVPYKEAVMPYLEELSPEARAIGAVNTLFRKKKKWIGTNTDAAGFLTALKTDRKFDPRGKKVLVLGAGGSARAVIYGLLKEKAARIGIANRHESRAKKIQKDFGRLFPKTRVDLLPLAPEALKDALAGADLVVNATSVGLRAGDPSLIPARIFPEAGKKGMKRILFFDLIYRPAETALLRLARRRGHRTANGASMLLYQGAKSFEIWTGEKAPVAVMRNALFQALKK